LDVPRATEVDRAQLRGDAVSRVDSPALRGTLLGRLLTIFNPVMKRLLQSPLHWPWSRMFAVVEWTGRRSQRRYSTPVAYMLRGDEVWVTTGDAWWRNLRSNPTMRVWLAGTPVEGGAALVTDAEESVQLHATMFEVRPIFARLAGLPARPTRKQIARAVDAGRVLVRIRLRDHEASP
jgi:deazaflavin-dependent oxidoreductase (nitroreductase family)